MPAVAALVPDVDHGVREVSSDNPTGFGVSIRKYILVVIAVQGTWASNASLLKFGRRHEEKDWNAEELVRILSIVIIQTWSSGRSIPAVDERPDSFAPITFDNATLTSSSCCAERTFDFPHITGAAGAGAAGVAAAAGAGAAGVAAAAAAAETGAGTAGSGCGAAGSGSGSGAAGAAAGASTNAGCR